MNTFIRPQNDGNRQTESDREYIQIKTPQPEKPQNLEVYITFKINHNQFNCQ